MLRTRFQLYFPYSFPLRSSESSADRFCRPTGCRLGVRRQLSWMPTRQFEHYRVPPFSLSSSRSVREGGSTGMAQDSWCPSLGHAPVWIESSATYQAVSAFPKHKYHGKRSQTAYQLGLTASRRRHEASIMHENIQAVLLGKELLRCFGDRFQIGEVEVQSHKLAAARREIRSECLDGSLDFV